MTIAPDPATSEQPERSEQPETSEQPERPGQPDGSGQSDRPEPARVDVADWVLRVCVAVLFGSVGYEKLSPGPDSYWVTLFAQIGFGEWFMYFTGAIQVLGALLVLIPRTAIVGTVLVGSTMVGAIGCHLFLLDTGIGGAVFPAGFLGLVIAAARRRLKGPPADAEPVNLRL